jgi:opacity protein-like surface antigen
MKSKFHIVFLATLLFVQLGLSQYTEKIRIYLSAGGTATQESIVGKTFQFPLLSRDIGSDFYTDFLGQKPNAENIQDYWNTGFNVGGGLIFDINSILAISTDFNYNQFSFNKDQMASKIGSTLQEIPINDTTFVPYNPDGLNISQGSLSFLELSFNVRAQFPHKTFRPYAMGGIGYTHINQDVININYYDDFNIPPIPLQGNVNFYDQIPAATYNAMMINGGVGLAVKLAKNFQPFIQANYVLGLTDGNNTVSIPIKFGFVFTLR